MYKSFIRIYKYNKIIYIYKKKEKVKDHAHDSITGI